MIAPANRTVDAPALPAQQNPTGEDAHFEVTSADVLLIDRNILEDEHVLDQPTNYTLSWWWRSWLTWSPLLSMWRLIHNHHESLNFFQPELIVQRWFNLELT